MSRHIFSYFKESLQLGILISFDIVSFIAPRFVFKSVKYIHLLLVHDDIIDVRLYAVFSLRKTYGLHIFIFHSSGKRP